MGSTLNTEQLARELLSAYSNGVQVPAPPSARDTAFSLAEAYAVEAEIARMRNAAGRVRVGLKVGYANKAMWRVLKLETLVWAHMYDDTVRHAADNSATLSLKGMIAPKIEPEIVFKLRQPLDGSTEPAAVLEKVEWIALGFEIIDCVFADWQFQPVDFVAAFGLHAALIVGQPLRVEREILPTLVEQLPKFKLRLIRNGELVEEGSGKNSLRSPALCLGELGIAVARQPGAVPLAAGELISSGTLTTPTLIAAGEQWKAEIEGLNLPSLTLRVQE
jgi:2-oxo-3-hexenedioate decarboxylase